MSMNTNVTMAMNTGHVGMHQSKGSDLICVHWIYDSYFVLIMQFFHDYSFNLYCWLKFRKIFLHYISTELYGGMHIYIIQV